jgi:hypothetical protein
VLGGRTVPVDRPRATLAGGGELALDSYAVFSATDLIGQLAMERMLAGVEPEDPTEMLLRRAAARLGTRLQE